MRTLVFGLVLFSACALAEKTDIKLTGQQGVHYFFTLSEPWASDQPYIENVAKSFCHDKPICFAHFWVAGKAAPKGFPLTDYEAKTEIAAYNHNQHRGVVRMLWSCGKFPKEPASTCFSD